MAKSRRLKAAMRLLKEEDKAKKQIKFNFVHEGKYYTVYENSPKDGSLVLIGDNKCITIGAEFCLTKDNESLSFITPEILKKARKNWVMDEKFKIIKRNEEQYAHRVKNDPNTDPV